MTATSVNGPDSSEQLARDDPNRPSFNARPIVGLSIGIVATFLCLGGILWGMWSAFKSHDSAAARQLDLQAMTAEISRLDEMLTTSVRYAVATGESRWEARHRETLPKLRSVISEAAALLAGLPEKNFGEVITQPTRGRVTAIENTAFDLVRNQRPQQAAELVFGENYESARRSDSAGVAFLVHAISERLDREMMRSTERMATTLVLALASSAMLLALWLALAGAIRRSLAEHAIAEQERRSLAARIQNAQRLESLSVLAGGIAHDFNNLLTGILSNAGTARRKLSANDPVQRHLSEIVQGSRLAAHLTAQLLAYAGKGQFQILARDLSAVVREIQELLETSVRRKAQLTYDLYDGLPAVQTDPSQLHQILMNLVLNASESIEGEVDVIIRTRVIDLNETDMALLVPGSALEPGRYVALEVEDSGWGMDRETLNRVFVPFFSTKSGGRGLGLAATLGIAHRHGGGIMVETELGRGTLFRVLFPASDEIAVSQPEKLVTDLSGTSVILVVDDDDYILQAVYAMLESYGYSVLLANSGRVALDIYRERCDEIDLVLLDMSMPGMSGEETFRELRKLDREVKVLLSTGYAPDEAAQRFTDTGLAGFLRKPFDAEQLGSAIKRILDREPEARPTGGLDEAMKGIHESYRRRLPEQLVRLRDAVEAARATGSAEALDAACALSHRLSGTAGSYGFEGIGEALRHVDSALRALVDGAADGDRHADSREQIWKAIDAAMALAWELMDSDEPGLRSV